MSFPIPCAHESGQEHDTSRVTPNYHPLTKDEIVALLIEAQASQLNPQRVAQIQVRLEQGIPGMTCPGPSDGPVLARSNELGLLYVEHFKEGPTPQLVDGLYALMRE